MLAAGNPVSDVPMAARGSQCHPCRRRPVSAGNRGPIMFTMRISNILSTQVAHGESYQGEDWERTFLRLMRGALSPGGAPRHVIHARPCDGEADGTGRRMTMSFRDGLGNVYVDVRLIVHTDPPHP